jgi:hypothetical protein
MKKSLKIVLLYLLVLSGLMAPARAEDFEKLAQTGMQFLSVISDARAASLSGAVCSTPMNSASLFFNPAGMAEMDHLIDVSASYNKWIADISHNTFSLAVNPKHGLYGAFGLDMQYVDYGEVLGTMLTENGQDYVDTEIIKPTALAVGLGYAKALNDRFSVGGGVRIVHWDLGENTVPVTEGKTTRTRNEITPASFNFGTFYKTGFKSLAFGMCVRNFSQEIKFADEGFQLPLVFAMGISMNVMDLLSSGGTEQSLLLMVDADHDRSHREQVMVGMEYKVMRILSLRGGYIYGNDEDNVSFGFGLCYAGFTFDYAYTPYGVFNNVQRVTVRLMR